MWRREKTAPPPLWGGPGRWECGSVVREGFPVSLSLQLGHLLPALTSVGAIFVSLNRLPFDATLSMLGGRWCNAARRRDCCFRIVSLAGASSTLARSTNLAQLRLSFASAGHVTGRVSHNPSQPLAIQAALYLESSTQANCNNKDAPEEHREVADAKQPQPRLVCQK